MPMHVSRKQFELYAEKALADIPGNTASCFNNISIIVQDMPDEEDVRLTGVPADELLGLFKGASIVEEESFFAVPPPLRMPFISIRKISKPRVVTNAS